MAVAEAYAAGRPRATVGRRCRTPCGRRDRGHIAPVSFRTLVTPRGRAVRLRGCPGDDRDRGGPDVRDGTPRRDRVRIAPRGRLRDLLLGGNAPERVRSRPTAR